MSDPDARCWVHIGAPKTGSSALQTFLYENRAVLRAQGLLYPEVSLRGQGHHDLAFLLSGGYPDWAIPQARPLAELLADLGRAAESHPGDILLSSENFYLFPCPVALKDALDGSGASTGRRTMILAYVRRQDEAHESWYNQTVKAQGATHEIAESIRRWRHLWDYRTQLSQWARVFGAENLVVRPYEEASFAAGSLIDDFAATVGISTTGLVRPAQASNPSLNRDLLEFQRLFNRLPVTIVNKRRFFRRLMALSVATKGSGRFDETSLLNDAQRREILASYAEGNREVALRYLDRTALFAPPPQGAVSSMGGLNPGKLMYILLWLIAHRSGEPNPHHG